MKGYGRIEITPTGLRIDCPGSAIPPGYQMRTVEPIDLMTVRAGDLVEYEIVPAPGVEAAKLRRQFPFDPKTGGLH